ncbi:MAG: 4a-hydroxytetrahydrobiopterin dehydratase [Candidatus Nitrosocaldus sp.]
MDRANAREGLMAKGWQYVDGRLSKKYALGSFIEAIEFVNDIAAVVESRRQIIAYPTITLEAKSVRLLLADDDVSITIAREVDELYDMNYTIYEDKGDELLKQEEDRERARFRSRGPYRKSSSAGLRW